MVSDLEFCEQSSYLYYFYIYMYIYREGPNCYQKNWYLPTMDKSWRVFLQSWKFRSILDFEMDIWFMYSVKQIHVPYLPVDSPVAIFVYLWKGPSIESNSLRVHFAVFHEIFRRPHPDQILHVHRHLEPPCSPWQCHPTAIPRRRHKILKLKGFQWNSKNFCNISKEPRWSSNCTFISDCQKRRAWERRQIFLIWEIHEDGRKLSSKM